jgi:hypothetical protein
MYVCMYACMYVCTYVYMYIHVYVCIISIYTHTLCMYHTYVHTHTHTNTHTHNTHTRTHAHTTRAHRPISELPDEAITAPPGAKIPATRNLVRNAAIYMLRCLFGKRCALHAST